ncbi:MAG: hypothetical protein JSW08_03315 [archaeon]|nr:MAG: hypothetical protein JSW08_03315 [archaeon]
MAIVKCAKCGKEEEHHAKGLCYRCYRKYSWKPKKIICKRCGRERYHHSQGYCTPCFNFLYHLDAIKAHNYRKWHNVDLETYRKITEKCVLCGFDKVVELHHLDGKHENNSEKNLIGLCPNHHKMLHDFKYRNDILNQLKEKGFGD